MSTKRKAIEEMRRTHAAEANRRADAAKAAEDAIVSARMPASPEETRSKLKAIVSREATRAVALVAQQGRLVSEAWATRDVAFRAVCRHQWEQISEEWDQCSVCKWCRPRVTQMLQIPPLVEGKRLPPLKPLDERRAYAFAGFEVSSVVRVRVAQYTVDDVRRTRRCAVEVRFKDYGWCEAALVNEDELYRVLPVIGAAERGKPRALWRALQKLSDVKWPPPWKDK